MTGDIPAAATEEQPPAPYADQPATPPDAVGDTALRVAGMAVALVATVLTAFLELQLSALRLGAFGAVLDGDSPYVGTGAPLPLAVPLAIGINLVICWFAVSTTGRRWAAGPPWALWTLIMLAAAGTRTAEGDYLVGGTNWVALVTILAGSLTFAVYVYRMILTPLNRAGDRPVSKDSELSGSV
ncbi:hypothetical protein Aph02nite_55140 [Actinoplanes philippinensis]|uniref:Uncharacterized protein n=1 Tax=Actinoplanes philippinensis TaxID=35752 RepID=A0A1I2J7U3_9ACTN|nr:hypothetical protein [Actinoplanes philippinensis]GIE79564.1 hypothetical protein Aph02nite_55140 [Actinoplanes philippinensis]SFF49277.1 hypothetical protein SAMN05421541_111287 [Actinoplanes philippinensis]